MDSSLPAHAQRTVGLGFGLIGRLRKPAAIEKYLLLQRLRFRFVAWRLRIQQRDELMGACGNADFPLSNDFLGAQFPAVELLICAAIRTQSRALKRDASKQSLIPRVREDLRVHDDVRRVFGG